MKKRLFFFLGVLCSLGFYSCQKSMGDQSPAQSEEIAANAKPSNEPPASLTDGNFAEISYVHDATNTFTEGPAVDKFGNVFFTDQNHDKIYRWDAASGNVALWLTGAGSSNGMAFDKDGSLIGCADMHGELWKIRPDGSHEVLVNN